MISDPSGLASANPTNPQAFNTYSYAQNNPLRNVDPTGLVCLLIQGVNTSGVNDPGLSTAPGWGGYIVDIDSKSTEGDCLNQGGDWVNGGTTASQIWYNAATGLFNVISSDVNNIYFYSLSVPGTMSQGKPCYADCVVDFSQYSKQKFEDQLVGGASDLAKALQWAARQRQAVDFVQAKIINHGNTNWCGAGGGGVPFNGNDWSCLGHDFNYETIGASIGYNYDPLYAKGPQLQRINQSLCNNVSGDEGDKIAAFFELSYWGCRH